VITLSFKKIIYQNIESKTMLWILFKVNWGAWKLEEGSWK
jgi:hypothetical protein